MSKILIPIIILVLCCPTAVSSELVCLKVKQKRNGKIKAKVKNVTDAECPRGFKLILDTNTIEGVAGPQGPAGSDGATGLQGPAGSSGAQGPQGNSGADGMDAAWGDGSAGDYIVSSGPLTFDEDNPQFDNVTIESGQTLIVASGTIIRCKGDFVNDGDIVVKTSASSGYNLLNLPTTTDVIDIPNSTAHPGISRSSATTGMIVSNSSDAGGGFGGFGMAEDTSAAYALTRPALYGGGAGAGINFDGGGFPVSSGGGSIAIYCEGSITNNGSIVADGSDALSPGDGGGGGGVVILASKGGVSVGTVSVKGGNGGAASASEAPGGGGGGGLIHVLAPTITDSSGSRTLAGGTGGTDVAAGTISNAIRAGGSGGGGSIGVGGWGSFVNADGSSGNFPSAKNGGTGLYLKRIVANPAGLLN